MGNGGDLGKWLLERTYIGFGFGDLGEASFPLGWVLLGRKWDMFMAVWVS